MKKLAVFFPGIGYTVDKPLLYYGRKLAAARDYEVRPLPYGGFPPKVMGDKARMAESFALARGQAAGMLADVDLRAYDDVVFFGKSIGTVVAAEYAASSEAAASAAPNGPTASAAPSEAYYEALLVPGAPHIVFVQQYVQGSVPPTAHSLVIDTETGLVTLCRATIGVPAAAREVSRTWHFGLIEGYADPGYRHAHTTELVGKAVFWTYYEKEQVRVKHIYSAPLYYSYTMLDPATGNCWMASNPADYVKITDDVFIFSFVEERQGGTQGFFAINTKELHDVGSFFGLQPHGLECYTFGAKGEWSEPFAYDWMN